MNFLRSCLNFLPTQSWLRIGTGKYYRSIRRLKSFSDMPPTSYKAALLRFWFLIASEQHTLHIGALTTTNRACGAKRQRHKGSRDAKAKVPRGGTAKFPFVFRLGGRL